MTEQLFKAIATMIYCFLFANSMMMKDIISSIFFGLCFALCLGWTILSSVEKEAKGRKSE